MKTFRLLFHIMRADFYERVRRYSFFVVAAVTVYIGIQYVPPSGADYLTISINSTRGIYNSAWVGTMFGLLLALIVPLPGFYLVKVAVGRDAETGVGQIIAATKLKKLPYLFGKTLSNFAVLVLILLIMLAIAPIMQIIRGEFLPVSLVQLYTPMILMALPMSAFVAVVGVLFETIGWLRGGFGNIVYLFVWVLLVGLSASGDDSNAVKFDYMGISAPLASIEEAYLEQIGGEIEALTIGITQYDQEKFETFNWAGIEWSGAYITQRVGYMLLAFGLVLPAGLFFDRFDPASHRPKKDRLRFVRRAFEKTREALIPQRSKKEANQTIDRVSLTPIQNRNQSGRLGAILYAEFLLLVKGLSWWWYLVIVGLNISALSTPPEEMLNSILPMLWIWPILVWSKLGSREKHNNTHQIVFSAPRPVGRNLTAVWLAGMIFSVLVSIGAAANLVLAGSFSHIFGWLVCVTFVPSLAIALSVLTGSHRLFEVFYLLLWYIAINKVPQMDFMGHTVSAIESGIPLVYLVVSIILIIIAFAGRSYQIRVE